MAPWLRLAALPTSLLALIASTAAPVVCQGSNWPYDLPPDAKYYPEDEVLMKRDIDIQQKLERRPVTGVRKMSTDPGEKFYLEYWGFEQEEDLVDRSSLTNRNATLFTSFDAPVRMHSRRGSTRAISPYLRLPGWHLFEKRGFQCPSGTLSCTSIGRPNSCCATGSTCQVVEDTGLGDVGCCPQGQVCADSLSTCESGYTSCPNNPGGGCCIPGYACYDVGCVQTSTATFLTVPTPSTTTVTSYTTITPVVSSPSSISSSPPLTLTSQPSTSTSTSVSSTATLPPQISTVTRTVTVTSSARNSLTCSTSYRSCPASLGGGCCPIDRECGSANCPPSSSTSTSSSSSSDSPTPAPPVRPTSLTTTEETTTVPGPGPSTRSTSTPTSSPTSTPVSGCPTGFYACSAYYQGGCCQVGRNCDKTSCPASASTTLVDTGSLTIVAPTGSGITAPGSLLTGACANGWTTCAPDVGGGCCPSGYGCGVSSCAASVSGGSDVGKAAPNSASRSVSVDSWMLGCACSLASLLLGTLAL
ncbi:hypothetical protein A1O1_08184 [Capronia coronata CBS 617.96]|uniref:GPI anchored protein n=1 Tax=Capronia coronata CBS 617.96 TaxID=1182541 RepID=W9XXM2_9EURO|nr:uncharacterized protein A1O1_08184 [Capronia coronata CBS 617.96]EXJ82115.1 hypothetical protein A1O1_08184 [Capronia coronata CBS 617.96]